MCDQFRVRYARKHIRFPNRRKFQLPDNTWPPNIAINLKFYRHYRRVFDHNFHVMGELYYRYACLMIHKESLKSKVPESALQVYDDEEDSDDDHNKKLAKCIECSEPTNSYCAKCDRAPYCQTCFDSIHAVGTVLKQHCLEALGADCAIHRLQPRKYYCVTCRQPICGACQNEQHSEHQTATLTKQVLKRKYIACSSRF